MHAPDNGSEAALSRSELTAATLLNGLARLISRAGTVADISPEAVSRELQLTLRTDADGDFSAVAQLTPDWNYLLDLRPGASIGPPVQLEFWPTDPASGPSMSSVCEIDLEGFAALLEHAGFERTPWFGEHGRRMGHHFTRGSVHVVVDTVGEADSPDKIGHECIHGIRVQ